MKIKSDSKKIVHKKNKFNQFLASHFCEEDEKDFDTSTDEYYITNSGFQCFKGFLKNFFNRIIFETFERESFNLFMITLFYFFIDVFGLLSETPLLILVSTIIYIIVLTCRFYYRTVYYGLYRKSIMLYLVIGIILSLAITPVVYYTNKVAFKSLKDPVVSKPIEVKVRVVDSSTPDTIITSAKITSTVNNKEFYTVNYYAYDRDAIRLFLKEAKYFWSYHISKPFTDLRVTVELSALPKWIIDTYSNGEVNTSDQIKFIREYLNSGKKSELTFLEWFEQYKIPSLKKNV